ncbi:MAG: hypothetical protein QM758_24795 [Armatimonas sp.]
MNPDWITRAENASTPEAELHALVSYALRTDANEARPLVLALAANPNLSPEDLLTLLEQRPSSMKVAPDNPAFPLHALANPEFFDKVPWALWRRLLNRVDTPEWILKWLLEHPRVPVVLAARWHVSQHPATDWRAALETLIPALPLWDHSYGIHGSEIKALTAAWAQGILPVWAGERLASADERSLRLEILEADSDGRLSGWKQLLQRASGGKALDRIHTKYDPDLTEAELIRLAGGGIWARRLAARHPNAPEDLLAWLATDAIDVRTAVLKNKATPESLKARMTEPTSHGYDVVRRLPNPVLPHPEDPLYPTALRIGLGGEPGVAFGSAFVLKQAPRRGALTAPDFTVRLHLALTESTPAKILKTLAQDANVLVRAAAQERLG